MATEKKKIDWEKEFQSASKAATTLFCIAIIALCASGYATPNGFVKHEQACAAVVQYRKDTGTAGIETLMKDPDTVLTTQQTLDDGTTVGPWMSKTITGIEIKEDGTILAPLGVAKTPCFVKIQKE